MNGLQSLSPIPQKCIQYKFSTTNRWRGETLDRTGVKERTLDRTTDWLDWPTKAYKYLSPKGTCFFIRDFIAHKKLYFIQPRKYNFAKTLLDCGGYNTSFPPSPRLLFAPLDSARLPGRHRLLRRRLGIRYQVPLQCNLSMPIAQPDIHTRTDNVHHQ